MGEVDYGNSGMDYTRFMMSQPDQTGVEQLKFLFEQDELETERLKNFLLGRIWNLKEQRYDDTGNRMINEYGANKLLFYSKPYLGKVINLSRFSEDMIHGEMLEYDNMLTELFMDESHLFGITLEESKRLKKFISGLVYSNYLKALNGKGADMIVKTARFEQIYKIQNQDSHKPSQEFGQREPVQSYNPFKRRRGGW